MGCRHDINEDMDSKTSTIPRFSRNGIHSSLFKVVRTSTNLFQTSACPFAIEIHGVHLPFSPFPVRTSTHLQGHSRANRAYQKLPKVLGLHANYILAVDADQDVALLDLLAGICRSPDAQGLDIDIVVVVGRIGAIFEDQSHTTLSSACVREVGRTGGHTTSDSSSRDPQPVSYCRRDDTEEVSKSSVLHFILAWLLLLPRCRWCRRTPTAMLGDPSALHHELLVFSVHSKMKHLAPFTLRSLAVSYFASFLPRALPCTV
mmetsp:Transcript_807/g.2462  ORF Transcript_807/g.2462 Transcript_807/m.2462 type:complete len:260 (+) Transcript_807:389-1168(+)